MSIRRQLILLICLPLLALYAAVLGWDYAQSRRQAIEQAEQLVAERAGNAASQINERLLAVQQSIDSAALMLGKGQAITEAQTREALFFTMRPNYWTDVAWIAFAPEANRGPGVGFAPILRRATMGGPGGPSREDTSPGRAPDRGPGRGFRLAIAEMKLSSPATSQPWYTTVQTSHKGTWFDPGTLADPNGDLLVVYAAPFYDTEGRFAGVVCGGLRVEDLQHLREDPSESRRAFRRDAPATTMPATTAPKGVAEGGYVLLDRQQRMLSHPESFMVHAAVPLRNEADERFAALRQAIVRASEGRGRVVSTPDLHEVVTGFVAGERYMLGLEPIRATGWVFMTAVPESQLLGPVQGRLIQRGAVLVTSVFALGLFATVLITRFCRPIEKMAGRVDQIARGKLDIEPIPVHSNDEIGKLARGFNTMTRELRRHVAALTEQSAARERVEGELRIARQIQTDLLPRTFPPFPERTEFDLHAVNIPARHIAGDFFDFFFSSDDVLTVVIADVSGKGVPAALMMAVTRTIVRNFAGAGATPAEIVDRANRTLLRDTQPGLFVTMMLGQYKPATGEFTFVNAGHPYAVRYGRDGNAALACPPTSPLLGVADAGVLGPIEQQTIQLDVGEGLFFYTDGITEARHNGSDLYGDQRLLNTVGRLSGACCKSICDGVVKDVMAFQRNIAADDVTMLSLRRLA